jgi:hypothetical protein
VLQVVELRGLFTAYLEQLQSHEGPEMEVLMVQALEATDLLDGCISLHKVGGPPGWKAVDVGPPRLLASLLVVSLSHEYSGKQ